jgi:glucose/mannose transport system permease protein
VLFPQLSPIALSAMTILGHMSLKMFDIIMAIILLVGVAVLVVPYLVYNARQEQRA